ncbi:hypothetical protein [Spiroplasma endosymbiont of Phycita roborella]|uniref:hypothetical protein n=1 Tax=Spiroplasma endosymbiont of Phycita roborella TaxID=3066311 RepID=UPI00313C91F5
MQDSKEILKNIQNEVEQQQEKINSKIKKWIKRNFYKITTIIALIFACIALGFACKDGRQKLSFYLKPDHTAVWGGQLYENIKIKMIKICFFYIFPIIRLVKKI